MEWITDTAPMRSDADYIDFVWVTTKTGFVLRIDWTCYDTQKHIAWMPITEPEPYVKQPRFTAKWSSTEECWLLCYKKEPIRYYWDLDKKDKHREAAEKIAAVYDEVMPDLY